MTVTLDTLRQRIREIEGPRALGSAVSSGSAPSRGPRAAEAMGLPSPGLVEVVGPLGSGCTRLVAAWAAPRTQRGERVAWVDPQRLLHPPTLQALGVAFDRLLLVRPAEPQVGWAVDQLLRSGCFGLVVLASGDVPDGVGRRWQQATRRGRCTLVTVGRRARADVPADVRVVLEGDVARVRRRRGGTGGQPAALPAWPDAVDPWGTPCPR